MGNEDFINKLEIFGHNFLLDWVNHKYIYFNSIDSHFL